MQRREPIWPVVVLIVGGALLLAGAARAGPQHPVYIPPILHQDSQQPDKLLSRAFRAAVALRVPVTADWRLTQPDPSVCRKGCVVVRIAGRRAPSPQYVLKLRRFPQGRELTSTEINGPSDTTPSLLADALLLKTSFLLRTELTKRHQPASAKAVTSRSRPAAARDARRGSPRFELGIGPTALLGMDADFISAGVELTATLRLSGPFSIRMAAGLLGNGEGLDYYSRFKMLPAHLLVGAQWSWQRFQLGLFAGGSVMLVWVDFDAAALGIPSNAEMNGLCGGPTAELRLALRVHSHVSVGLGARATYVVNRLATEVGGSYGAIAYFSIPEALLQTTLDVTLSF